jgi:hypothetical protein
MQWPKARVRAIPKQRKNPDMKESLKDVERLFHVLTQDLSAIVGVLPHHLHRAQV